MGEKNEKSLRELVSISREVGKDPSMVLGAFGNTSVKTPDGRYMYIKASSTALKDMSLKKGWKRLKLRAVLSILSDSSVRRLGAYERESEVSRRLMGAVDHKCGGNLRPSIESFFHAFMPRYVIHLHPSSVLVYACAKRGEEEVRRLFSGEGISPLWISYAHPGYSLAMKIEEGVRGYQRRGEGGPVVMFLQNHGLVTAAENADKALSLSRKVVNKCRESSGEPGRANISGAREDMVKKIRSSIKKCVEEATGRRTEVSYFINETIGRFLSRRDAGNLLRSGPITPDELVYTKGPAVWLRRWDPKVLMEKMNKRKSRAGEFPAGYLIKPAGLFVIGERKRSILLKDIICASLIIRARAAEFGGVRALSKGQRQFIESILW